MLLSATAFSAFALLACARSSAHPPAAMGMGTPVRGKRAQLALVPVSPSPKPTDYSRFSRDGRFAYANGFLYDRGSCVPRARVSEETMAALESTPGSGWEATGGTPNDEAVNAAVRSLSADDMTSCTAGTFDPITGSLFVMCTREGAEYQSFDGSWVALGTPPRLPSLCVGSPNRSDITESFGDDVRWSRDHNMFTFLDLNEGWNFRERKIHIVDLRAGTHDIINDDEAADRRDPPSYDKVTAFDASLNMVARL